VHKEQGIKNVYITSEEAQHSLCKEEEEEEEEELS